MAGEKQALKGLTAARLWPVTANTATAYTTGTMMALEEAQGLTKDTSTQDYTIYADDAVYYSGSDYLYEELVLKLAQLPLSIEAQLGGSEYDETEQSYVFKNTDVAPEYALGYAARRLDGEYRMFQHYSVRLTKIKVEHRPKPDGTDIQSYELTLRSTQRKADGAVRRVLESDDKTYTKLNTIDNIPVTP